MLMEPKIETILRGMFLSRKFQDINRLAEFPGLKIKDSWALQYCSAIAYLCQRDCQKAISRLWGMLARFKETRKTGSGCNDAELVLFMAQSALQLAQLVPYALADVPAVCRYGSFGCNLAIELSGELGREDIVAQAQKIISFYVPWEKTGPGNERSKGWYYMGDSPLLLQIEPTNFCNVRCKMCPHSAMKRKKGFMDIGLFKDILSGWKNMCGPMPIDHLVHNNVKVTVFPGSIIKLFFMGDPLLHPQIDDLISYGQAKGVRVGIQTNGVLLADPKVREKLLSSRPDAISVSIHGISKDTYEEVIGGKKWDVVCEGISSFSRERAKRSLQCNIRLCVSSILLDGSDRNVELLLKFLEPLKPFVDSFMYMTLDTSYSGQFYDLEGNIVAYEGSPSIPSAGSPEGPLCIEALDKMNILWDGTATACCYDIEGDYKLGDVREGVDNVWMGGKALSLRKALLKADVSRLKMCQKCKGVA